VLHTVPRQAIGLVAAFTLLLSAALPAIAVEEPTQAPVATQSVEPVEPTQTPGPTQAPDPTLAPTPPPTEAPTLAPTVAPTATPPSGGAIQHGASLTVTFLEGSRPLAGADLTLVADLGGGAIEAFAARTDASGRATFEGLPYPTGDAAGFDWVVRGRLSTVEEGSACRSAADYRGTITVAASAGDHAVDMPVTEAVSSIICDLVGRVVDPDGEPFEVTYAAVHGTTAGGAAFGFRLEVDEEGGFQASLPTDFQKATVEIAGAGWDVVNGDCIYSYAPYVSRDVGPGDLVGAQPLVLVAQIKQVGISCGAVPTPPPGSGGSGSGDGEGGGTGGPGGSGGGAEAPAGPVPTPATTPPATDLQASRSGGSASPTWALLVGLLGAAAGLGWVARGQRRRA
jgi:hypothetical protein